MDNLYKNKKNLEFKNKNLDKLYKCLSKNRVWIKISNEKYKTFNYSKELKQDEKGFFKPPGSWYSKGTWLFYELGMNLSNLTAKGLKEYENDKREIILIKVDEGQIYTISGNKPGINPLQNKSFNNSFKKFTRKYVNTTIGKSSCNYLPSINNSIKTKKQNVISNKKFCKKIKTAKSCNKHLTCYWSNKFNIYDFNRLYKDGYNGFAINPYPGSDSEYFNSIDLAFRVYDTESLVLFNSKPVLEYNNIGNISEIISSIKGKVSVAKLINELCNRINQF